MPRETKPLYRFGRFELDPAQHVLLREGRIVQLTPKAIELLLVLVESRGRVISKEDLLQRVWPHSFVEEANLSHNIYKLREALGDDSDELQCIETLPRRGYRFVPQVEEIHPDAGDLVVEEHSRAHIVVEEETADATVPASQLELPAIPNPRSQRRWMAVAAVVVGLLAVGYFYRHASAAKLTDKDTLVLADFVNTTGDPVFDGALRQGLSVQLEQSPFLNILSDDRIAETLALMTQPKGARLTEQVARQVCVRTASTATIEGSISSLGSQYVLGLTAVNCDNGNVLAREQVTANGKEQVLNVLGEAATKMREKLGESLASVQKYDTPLSNATTPSLEALQAYSLGNYAHTMKNDWPAAIPLFQRAISLDHNFAMAYAGLGSAYTNLGQTVRAEESTRKAYELRERVSEREKFFIVSRYEVSVTGNIEATRQTLGLWAQTYPRDGVPLNNLGVSYRTLGDYEKALAAFQTGLRIAPATALRYGNLVLAFLQLDRLSEAKAAAQDAQTRHLDSPHVHQALYLVAFLQHDAAGMKRESEALAGKPGYEDIAAYYQSDTAAYAGQLVRARELTREAVSSAERSDKKETAAAYLAEAAVREALVGNLALAKKQALAALALSNGRDAEAMSAIAMGFAGDLPQATRLAGDLAKRFPEDTIVQSMYLPAIDAVMVLPRDGAAKNANQAIEFLAAAAPYELGAPLRGQNFSLYPVYVRGEAYLAAHQGPPAVAEFQKILDHPGVVVNEPIGALAYLQLGRAYILSGETAKAKAAYHAFLTLWKDADPDIPILKQATAEYAKL